MGAEALTEPQEGRADTGPGRVPASLRPRRYGVAVLRFAAANGMLSPKYARLALRWGSDGGRGLEIPWL